MKRFLSGWFGGCSRNGIRKSAMPWRRSLRTRLRRPKMKQKRWLVAFRFAIDVCGSFRLRILGSWLMLSQPKRVYFGDFVFLVDENVYEPSEDSFLFAENLDVKEGERVLDMGTGCGIVGVLAARKACEVVAVDVNPHAVRCARENA